jgi:hypothetical protein
MSPEKLHSWAAALPRTQRQFWEDQNYEPASRNMDLLFTDSFLSSLRRGASCGIEKQLRQLHLRRLKTSQNASVFRVVAHYHRGDADTQHRDVRAKAMTHAAWFFTIMKAIAQLNPRSDLRALTSCSNDGQCHELETNEVLAWRTHGIQLRVDDERSANAADAWKNAFAMMASADVFIMSKSLLSHVSALFNPNCVIRNPSDVSHHPLKSWIEVQDPQVQAVEHLTTGGHVDWHVFKGEYDGSQLRVVGNNATNGLGPQLHEALSKCQHAVTRAPKSIEGTSKRRHLGGRGLRAF